MELSQTQNTFPTVIYKLFEKRGFTGQDITEFLSWDLKNLPDFSSLKDIEKCAQRIITAIDNKENIGIYGDYDVDGTTSCALFYHFFKKLGIIVSVVQPSRFIEGYGIHNSSIDQALENNISLLITVDCGISNNEVCDYAKEKGLDLIITDHHKDARETMPDAYAIVNPNRRDEPKEGDLPTLAGVGVAFAICVEVRKILLKLGRECESVYDLLQFVAIGTICDLAKLTPMNLKLVRHGLKAVKETKYAGIKAFFSKEERQRDLIPSEKLGFNVGPLINSKGRLDHPEIALKVLIADDYEIARENYQLLVNCNNERKNIQNEVFEEAKEEVLKSFKKGHEPLINIVYAPHWHEGVIGIVASKLVDSFKKPAIVFTNSEHEGIIKASARSAGELNIFNLLDANKELFLKFGGHKAAAGLSMPTENLETFKENMNNMLMSIPEIERTVTEFYDLELNPDDITPAFVKALDLLEPFGMGNEKPKFRLSNCYLKSFDLMKDVHVRWTIGSTKNPQINLKGISFNYTTKWGNISPSEVFERQKSNRESPVFYFTLGINHFNGNQFIQLMVDKVEF